MAVDWLHRQPLAYRPRLLPVFIYSSVVPPRCPTRRQPVFGGPAADRRAKTHYSGQRRRYSQQVAPSNETSSTRQQVDCVTLWQPLTICSESLWYISLVAEASIRGGGDNAPIKSNGQRVSFRPPLPPKNSQTTPKSTKMYKFACKISEIFSRGHAPWSQQ